MKDTKKFIKKNLLAWIEKKETKIGKKKKKKKKRKIQSLDTKV